MRTRALLLVLLVAGLLLPQAAYADDPTPSVALSAPASGHAGVAAPFTITVLDAAAAPLADAAVSLQRASGDTWVPVASGTTDGTGHLTLSAALPWRTSGWRATYAADASHTYVSPTIDVLGVRHSTRMFIGGPASVVDESTATLRVFWVASDGSPVSGVVTLYRRYGSGPWVAYRHLLTDATGHASVTTYPRYDTSWRAVGTPGPWWFASASGIKTIDNRPQGTPVSYPSAAPRPTYISPNARATTAGADPVVTGIPYAVWRSMVGRTWHSGCPVGRSSLRLLRVNYWGFDGYRYRGEMVLSAAVASRAGAAFADMYAGHYPIRRMFREDRFGWSSVLHGANDYASMRADNTSGFNCRSVVNRPGVRSPHASGRAIDLNTWENPYRSATGLVPDAWWAGHSDPRMAWRSYSHPVVRIWRAHGFHWTYANLDSQHYDGRPTTVLLGGFTG